MPSKRSWKMVYAARDHAAKQGEEVANTYAFTKPPVDPFLVVRKERQLIHVEQYDFREAFDGRIKYVGPRFLICLNTRYNSWPHSGMVHSKVLFTLAHELGHFYLPKHREYLVTSRVSHGSLTEFTSDPLVEQEADSFATGLLMPGYLLRHDVNTDNFPSLRRLKSVRADFQVSLTGMLVRWTQLSDFPCATIATRSGRILYGWVSQALVKAGAFRLRRGQAVIGRDAKRFIAEDPEALRYRDRTGSGAVTNWIDYDERKLVTEEHYFTIPHSKTVWILVIADEKDLMVDRGSD